MNLSTFNKQVKEYEKLLKKKGYGNPDTNSNIGDPLINAEMFNQGAIATDSPSTSIVGPMGEDISNNSQAVTYGNTRKFIHKAININSRHDRR